MYHQWIGQLRASVTWAGKNLQKSECHLESVSQTKWGPMRQIDASLSNSSNGMPPLSSANSTTSQNNRRFRTQNAALSHSACDVWWGIGSQVTKISPRCPACGCCKMEIILGNSSLKEVVHNAGQRPDHAWSNTFGKFKSILDLVGFALSIVIYSLIRGVLRVVFLHRKG